MESRIEALVTFDVGVLFIRWLICVVLLSRGLADKRKGTIRTSALITWAKRIPEIAGWLLASPFLIREWRIGRVSYGEKCRSG
jgi:hypothetical protein